MPEMKIKPAFSLGQIVWLKSDECQYERIVTAIHVTCSGLLYEVRLADEDVTVHTLVELSHEKLDKEQSNNSEEDEE